MKWGLHLKFWILLTLIVLLSVPALVSVQSGLDRVSREVEMTRSVFGDDMTEHIVGRAKAVYKTAFVDTGFIADLNKTHLSQDDVRKAHAMSGALNHFSALTNSYFGSMVINLYGMMIRLFIIGHWLVYVAPARIAAYLRTQPRRTAGASTTPCTANPRRCSGSDSVCATRPLHSQALNTDTAAAPSMSNG